VIGVDQEATQRERALLADTSALLSVDQPLDRLMARLCKTVGAYVDTRTIYFALLRRRKRERVEYAYRCGQGRTTDVTPVELPDSRKALATSSPLLRPADSGLARPATMTIPIRGVQGTSALLILEAGPGGFDSEDLRSLEAVGRFLGIAIRNRRLVGVTGQLQRSPVLATLILATLAFATAFLLFDFNGKSKVAVDHELAAQTDRARAVVRQLESTLLVAEQVTRSTTAVVDSMRRDRPRIETTLSHLLVATRADTIYGIGAWFEPGFFDPKIHRFAPYVHRNAERSGPNTLTYRWSTRRYDYLQRDWYREGERALGRPIFAPPNVDTDVAVISVVQGFYDRHDGKFGGDVTVNLGVPFLRSTIRHYNDAPGRMVYVTTAEGAPFLFPEEPALLSYARAHGSRAAVGYNVSPELLHDYISVTHPGRRFDVQVPVRNANWVVHVSALNARLYFELVALRYELGRTLFSVWLAAGLGLWLLRVHYLQTRRTFVAEIEKTHLVNEKVRREHISRRLERVAYFDRLTGLPNRNQLLDRVGTLLKRKERTPFAVLYLDIDRLNSVNDRYGRATGDGLLKAVATRLERLLQGHAHEFAARISGDEFVVVLETMADRDEAIALAREIASRMLEPFELGEFEISSSARVGIALGPDDYRDAAEMLRDADLAMSNAHASEGDRYRIFDRSMNERVLAQLALERELRRAIDRNELRLLYQPIVALETGALEGFEALLRWQHPSRGLLAPGDFLAVAERFGIVIDIGRWALPVACRARAAFAATLPDACDFYVSVNLAATHFSDSRLVGDIRAAVAAAGITYDSLKLEVTESALLEDSGPAGKVLEALRDLGVCTHLDDFGTGYSSLSYLHRLPLEILKIDRSFVIDVANSDDSREIVRTIVALAATLRLDVIAEGIEETTQLDELAKLGVQYGQGYLFSRPLDEKRAVAFLAEHPPLRRDVAAAS